MSLLRFLCSVAAALALAGSSAGATPKEIDAAVQKGAAYLKQQFDGAKPAKLAEGEGIGPAALAGLALLETGTPADDKSVRAIAAAVRDAAFGETRTYHLALCVLFLDRYGDPADVPIIQMLAVRLLAGQNSRGGWTYSCIDAVPPVDEARLRAGLMVAELKAGQPGGNAGAKPDPVKPSGGKLHAEVAQYAGKLAATRRRERGDDNSNTQFGVLGVWAARKHGVPVEGALDLIEKRFLATQTATGGWPYGGTTQGSPSMTCAGLIGLATAVGRREERLMKAEGPRKPDAKADPAKPMKSDDPFFNPPPAKTEDPFFTPPKAGANDPKPKATNAPKRPIDPRDAAVERGLAALATALTGDAPAAGKGKGAKNRIFAGAALSDRDFYFLWSLERVGVIFGVEKIGKFDWYDLGADELVEAQHANGAWGKGARGGVVDTSFALLFLSRSNLVRDLTAKVQRDPANAELRAGNPFPVAPEPAPMPKLPAPAPNPVAVPPNPAPAAVPAADSKVLFAELAAATGAEWDKALVKVRDGKGAAYTQALVTAAGKFEGDRRKAAREALAERLTRMTAATLRTMAKDIDTELRRAALLAMAMKDEKEHIPDLVASLLDTEELVVRAAHAGLKSLTGEDFGPAPGATAAERAAALRAWAEWLRKK